MLQLAIVGRTEEGELVFDQAVWAASQPSELPSLQQLEADIEERLKKLDEQKKSARFDDDYTGPVLLEGSSVADFMSSLLFMGDEPWCLITTFRALPDLEVRSVTPWKQSLEKCGRCFVNG